MGTFTAQLYGTVTLSTEPRTATEAMFSWFPAVFPLRRVVYVNKGEVRCARTCVRVHVCADDCGAYASVCRHNVRVVRMAIDRADTVARAERSGQRVRNAVVRAAVNGHTYR